MVQATEPAIRRTVWNFNAPEYELPGGRGRLEQLSLDNGLELFRAEFHVEDTCIVATQHDYNQPLIGSMMHLIGRSMLRTPDGRRYEIRPGMALMSRLNAPGTSFIIPGGQVLRHVGVAGLTGDIARRFGGKLPPSLAPFADRPSTGAFVRSFRIPDRLRKITATLFTAYVEGADRRLVLEGLAAQIMADLIQALDTAEKSGGEEIALWERQAIDSAAAHIRENLERPLNVDSVAKATGLTRHRLLALFPLCLGRSFRAFVRGERLELARRLIEEDGAPVKIAAAKSGYNHVSNFSTAYLRHFGETPGRASRRATANGDSDET